MKNTNNSHTLAIIPCYNEEITIGSIVLKTKPYVDKILVINDGSNDDTSKIAQQAGATVISHKKNKGKTAAIKTGFKYAISQNFDYAVTIDGDAQHNPREIPTVLENVVNNGNDISLGVRYGNNTEMPIWRKVGKRILDFATSMGNGGTITDSQCGFRAFNKKAIKALTSRLTGEAFSVESEQLIKAHELGLSIGKTRISCKYKNLDTSTKNPTSHGSAVLKYVIWLVAQRRPLLFISIPGLFLVLIGIFIGILTLQYYNQTHVFLIPYAIITAIFLIIGAIGMFIGLVLNVLPSIVKQANRQSG
jgi:glycosyltransferase involved in cell wall biosynthesis